MDYSGASNIRELNYILTNHIMIRRLKKDVLTELPDKMRQKVNVEVD
jgi:SWI/SNF-related matrix-associated actin-dependent regulator of chromatin subfamily A-like protein 1